MALTIHKSMEVQGFPENWELIKAMVKAEYEAVEGLRGYYDLRLELIWDCEEKEWLEKDIQKSGNPPME